MDENEAMATLDAAASAVDEGDVDRFMRYMRDLERMGMEYGDTPSRRKGYGDDWDTSGLPLPPGLIEARARMRADAQTSMYVRQPNANLKVA